jgi:hypothetical protein
MDTKRCSRCGEQLPLNMFYRGYQHGDGLTPHCKRCAAVLRGKVYNGNRNKDRDAEIPEGYKLCPKCSAIKSLDEFDRCTSKKSGYQSHCKICRRAKYREGKPEPEILPDDMKRCWDCKQVLPANPDVFSRNKMNSDGLSGQCKVCATRYRRANRERIIERKKRYYAENSKTINERFKDKTTNDPEFRAKYLARRKEHYYEHHEEIREKQKLNYKENIEKHRIYRATRKEYNSEYNREYYQRNREQIRQSHQKWYQSNLEENRKRKAIYTNLRRKLKLSLPTNFSLSDWSYALEYFEHKCAICGREANSDGLSMSMDHWIPISDPRPDNLGTVPENIVPLCHGLDGCNNSKSNLDPKIWLIRKLGAEAGLAKLAEVEAYFQHLRDRKSDTES